MVEGGEEVFGAEGVEQFYHGDVKRQLQGLTQAEGAVKLAVEVLRGIGAEADGAIFDQGFGMAQASIEGEGVNHWFQCRTW